MVSDIIYWPILPKVPLHLTGTAVRRCARVVMSVQKLEPFGRRPHDNRHMIGITTIPHEHPVPQREFLDTFPYELYWSRTGPFTMPQTVSDGSAVSIMFLVPDQ